ncbi:5,10-methylenetetrahydrofolate reductase [Olavius algarvensis spirochete endosymbiont]|nr:5,10-methylenetetrahydrofolate reductase [Olavius algarvensis spirochete endosymbiont]
MRQLSYSLEVFPTRTPAATRKFWHSITVFKQLQPAFYSVTANPANQINGSIKAIANRIKKITGAEVAAHMVLSDHNPETLDRIAQDYWDAGIKHIVALRGDETSVYAGKKRYAKELVEILLRIAPFNISVAGYPEKHPQCKSLNTDIDNLKDKIDAGAKRVITQFFFDPDVFLRFRDMACERGINVQIVPGLLPIVNFSKLTKFAEKCGTNVPDFLLEMFNDGDELDHKLLAMNVLSHQITKLLLHGVKHIHFYTLNETVLTSQVCRWLEIAF